jgi:hypothetical protein
MGTWKENVIMMLANKCKGKKTTEYAELCCAQGRNVYGIKGRRPRVRMVSRALILEVRLS